MNLKGLKDLAKTVSKAQNGGNFEEEFLFLLKTKMEKLSLLEEQERWEYEKNDVPYAIHPSSIGACCRCIYYNFLKYEPEGGTSSDAILYSIQDNGTYRHERIQSFLYDMGPQFLMLDPIVEAGRARGKGINTFVVDQDKYKGKKLGEDYFEIRCHNTDLPIWFQTDGIFAFKGLKGIFEFKTELQEKHYTRVAPEPTHIEQAMTYAYAFDLDYILFLYEERNLFRKKAYLIKVDPDKQRDLLEKYSYLRLHADNNELPPSEKEKCKKSYCKHPNKCKLDQNETEKWERYMEYKKGVLK